MLQSRWPTAHSRLPHAAARPRRTLCSPSAAAAGPAPLPAEISSTGISSIGTAPSTSSSSGNSSTLQVTRQNFRQALQVVREALAECQFFAFDCEMTGLTLEGQEDKLIDDVFDRHERTVAAASQFIITQFGLSAFIWCPTSSGSSSRGGGASSSSSSSGSGERQAAGVQDGNAGGTYEARTFNFYLFPSPRGDFDLRFSCQASSLAFLASQGFDFNKVSNMTDP